jgi:hypothetical protein
MRGLGWTLVAVGAALIIWSCSITTTVHTDANYMAGIGYQAPTDTYNLGLLQRQMMLLQAGLALFIAGTISACIGEVRAAMRRAGTAKYLGYWESDAPSDSESPAQVAATE